MGGILGFDALCSSVQTVNESQNSSRRGSVVSVQVLLPFLHLQTIARSGVCRGSFSVLPVSPSGPGPPLSWHDCEQQPRLGLAHPGGQPPPQPQQHRHPPGRRQRRRQEAAAAQKERLLHLRAGHHQAAPGLPLQVRSAAWRRLVVTSGNDPPPPGSVPAAYTPASCATTRPRAGRAAAPCWTEAPWGSSTLK